eukprot:364697-Chlamydomonas_euryale.AAC.3
MDACMHPHGHEGACTPRASEYPRLSPSSLPPPDLMPSIRTTLLHWKILGVACATANVGAPHSDSLRWNARPSTPSPQDYMGWALTLRTFRTPCPPASRRRRHASKRAARACAPNRLRSSAPLWGANFRAFKPSQRICIAPSILC